MLKPNDIRNQHQLPHERKTDVEKLTQSDDLHYLASQAFEQFSVKNEDIDHLIEKVNKASKTNSSGFQTLLIAVLCGLLIGISAFFIIFQKSKTHASVFQDLSELPKSENSLHNIISANDTLFPSIAQKKPVEHFNTIAEKEEPVIQEEVHELLQSKSITTPIQDDAEEDIVYQFTPNAPVIFIENLKVANYRLYYFKQTDPVDLNTNTGVPAQYENKSQIERTVMNSSNTYLAHKVIQKAMRFFNSENLSNCIEELTILYSYNKNDANAQFYLGMCYYKLGKFAAANNYFQKNLDNATNIFHQESEYYQAMCLLNLKQTEEAVAQLTYVVNNKGFYAERAQQTLLKLKK